MEEKKSPLSAAIQRWVARTDSNGQPDPFLPSKYQMEFFKWVISGRGDSTLEAVAGSGKTSTLTKAAELIGTRNAVFCAFNKHIAEELNRRIGHLMECKTIHQLGRGALAKELQNRGRRLDMLKWKYSDLIKPDARQLASEIRMMPGNLKPTEWELSAAIKNLLDMSRLTLTPLNDGEAVSEMIDHYGIEIPVWSRYDENLRTLVHLAERALIAGEDMARDNLIIDFTDMIYLPVKWDLIPYQYEWVFVDEAQDLNNCQLELALKLRGKGGRMAFVGDARQAIYGFAGANNESFSNIQLRLKSTNLPLSICYRCPEEVIKVAQTIVPAIQPRPNAPTGVVRSIRESKLDKELQTGDLILCRVTAPLIKLCLHLIGKRIPARVKGRDIGAMLGEICAAVQDITINSLGQKAVDTDEVNVYKTTFRKFLGVYHDTMRAKLEQKAHSEAAIEALDDKVASVAVCYVSFGYCQTVEMLQAEIAGLFSDDRASITLSTVHRAKGLENERVFILKPDKLPLVWSKQREWEFTQEENLRYVAITRALSELVWVEDDGTLMGSLANLEK